MELKEHNMFDGSADPNLLTPSIIKTGNVCLLDILGPGSRSILQVARLQSPKEANRTLGSLTIISRIVVQRLDGQLSVFPCHITFANGYIHSSQDAMKISGLGVHALLLAQFECLLGQALNSFDIPVFGQFEQTQYVLDSLALSIGNSTLRS